MKLVTYRSGGDDPRIGVLLPGETTIADLTATGEACFRDMIALMSGGDRALDAARTLEASPQDIVELAAVTLLAPVPLPTQMFDCLCFEEHLINSANHAHLVTNKERVIKTDNGGLPSVYRELPVYYKGNRFSVVGTGADIIRPNYTKFLDYELEFGVFLGKTGKDMTPEEAEDAIFGYTIFNDVSARDAQISEMRGLLGPSKGKDFDTGNVMGPWLVTKDEVPVEKGLRMRAWINGDLVTDGNSAKMLHTFPEIVAYASQSETRRPGEFFGSGTVGGGCGLEHGRFLQDGDVLELEVEGLGRLTNTIVFGSNG